MYKKIKTGEIKIQTNQTFELNRDNIGNQIEAIPLQIIRKTATTKHPISNSINDTIIFSPHKKTTTNSRGLPSSCNSNPASNPY